LTGSGGCGKTRLALEVASQQATFFAEGARFVELANVVGNSCDTSPGT
jgi:predicted ATPase